MKRKLFIAFAAASLLSCDSQVHAKGHCTIVTDGSREVFRHELAHCNSWTHEPFESADPPASFVHPYDGRLTYIPCGRNRAKPQPGAEIVEGCRSVQKRCFKLWKDHGVDVSAWRGTEGYQTFNGCSF